MKKLLLWVFVVLGGSMLAACTNDEQVTLDVKQAIENAEFFVSQSGSMNQIKEVIETYEYETKEGAKAVILEVRLGSDNASVASTSYIKVWKNNAQTGPQVNWSSEQEVSEKTKKEA